MTDCGSMLGNQQGPTNRCLQFAKALSLRALQIAKICKGAGVPRVTAAFGKRGTHLEPTRCTANHAPVDGMEDGLRELEAMRSIAVARPGHTAVRA